MCGIIGILGAGDVTSSIVAGLKRLEYRGYDSAGVATVHLGQLNRRRAAGKLGKLEAALEAKPLSGASGIGHTRWATHGAPTQTNAHPQATDPAPVVHNGIIENYRSLRTFLEQKGVIFKSETDTETIAHLIDYYYKDDLQTAVRTALLACRPVCSDRAAEGKDRSGGAARRITAWRVGTR